MKQLFGALSGALFALVSMSASAAVDLGDNEYIQFYHRDVLGSPLAVSDEKGRILWYENTAPYGKSLGRVAADGTRFDLFPNQTSRDGYTGHIKDVTSGLTYMRARYYDPALGQLISNDPIGFNFNNPNSFNRYLYANNNPYRFTDPSGMSSEDGWTEISTESVTTGPSTNDAGANEILASLTGGSNSGSGSSGSQSRNSGYDGQVEVAGGWFAAAGTVAAGLCMRYCGKYISKYLFKRNPVSNSGQKLLANYSRTASLNQKVLDKIVKRHWYNSIAKKVGKFSREIGLRQLRDMIDVTVKNGVSRPNTHGRPGRIFEQNFGQSIGTGSSGGVASNLRVVVDNKGTVVTAFPF